jgi:hypothetical protein
MASSIEPRVTDSHEYFDAYAAHFALGLPSAREATNHFGLVKELAAIRRREAAAGELKLRLLDALGDQVTGYNMMSWAIIGDALGVSAQAASQLHKRRKAAGRA